jgi:Uma2 family endonuclease
MARCKIEDEKNAMSTIAAALKTWEEFLTLPDPPEGSHLELRDGEVVCVPAPAPRHYRAQSKLSKWLTVRAGERGQGVTEFPYRPAANLQFWHADVAYVPDEVVEAMNSNTYPIYAPPLVVEVLSPSNTPGEITRRRIAALSGGTREFWVIDLDSRTIEVSRPGARSQVYGIGDSVPVSVLDRAPLFPVQTLFED